MRLIIAACLSLALTLPAQSELRTKQVQLRKGPIGQVIEDFKTKVDPVGTAKESDASEAAQRKQVLLRIAKPFQDLAAYIGDDAEGAIALATQIPGIQDGHGQQCWIEARNFTSVFRAHPVPITGGGMTDLQALRLLAISSKRLCSDPHCDKVFTDFKNMAITVAQAVSGAIGATMVKAAPSLSDVCFLVPTIDVVAPLNPVPSAPDVGAPQLGPLVTPNATPVPTPAPAAPQ